MPDRFHPNAPCTNVAPKRISERVLAGLAGTRSVCATPPNPTEILLLPLGLGISLTNGIHILNRFTEEQRPGFWRTARARQCNFRLTCVAGFGSLENRGVASLGLVMAIDVATCMGAGLTSLPALIKSSRLTGRKKPSDDNAITSLGWEEPR